MNICSCCGKSDRLVSCLPQRTRFPLIGRMPSRPRAVLFCVRCDLIGLWPSTRRSLFALKSV